MLDRNYGLQFFLAMRFSGGNKRGLDLRGIIPLLAKEVKVTVRKMTKAAMMTCLIIICSWISIPFTVPFTMQTFAVFCSLLFLGGKYGLISIAIYILAGAVGVPVFAGFQGGIGHLMGPTGGYVLGFILTALIYLLAEKLKMQKNVSKGIALLAGLAVCYLFGTLWFSSVYSGGKTGFVSALSVCVLPYVVPDLLKLTLAFYIYRRVRRSGAA